MGGDQHIALDGLQAIIQGGDGLQIQVVGGLVKQQHVGPGEHHPGEHAPHLLAAGEHLDGLVNLVAGEEHPAQETPQIGLVGVGRPLPQPLHQIVVAVLEELGVVLREVGEGGGLAPLDGALVGLQLAGEDLEQGGLGVLVVAHEGDLVPVAHDEAHLVQHLHSVDGLADVGDEEDVLAHLSVGREGHPGVAAGGGGDLLQGDLLQQFAPGGGLLALGLVGGEAGDELLQLLGLLLVLLVLVLHQVLHELGGVVPEVVVAHVHLDLVVVDVHDVGADGVEEVAVVADHNHRALKVQQEVLQPVHRVDVQVVGGLVQQQDVRIAEQGLGQQHLHLQPGVQGGHVVGMELGAHAQALEDAAGVALGLPAAQLGVLLLQLAGADAVGLGHLLLGIEGLLLLADVVEALVAHDDGVHDVVGVVGVLILLEHRHAGLGQDGDLAGGGLQLAGEDFQEGGFTRAVGADDAVADALGELEIHVGKEGLAAVGQAQVGNCNHVVLLFMRKSSYGADYITDCSKGPEKNWTRRPYAPCNIKCERTNTTSNDGCKFYRIYFLSETEPEIQGRNRHEARFF